MPKLKTKSGAKKRFRITANGKIKRWRAGSGHIKRKKRPPRKRRLRQSTTVDRVDEQRIKKVLGK